MEFVLAFPPSENDLYIPFSFMKAGRRVHSLRPSPELKAYQAEQVEALEALRIKGKLRGEPLTGVVSVSITWYFTSMRGDLTNRRKAVLDVMEGFAYKNDRQVHHFEEERLLQRGHPRAVITVETMAPRVMTHREELEQLRERVRRLEARLADKGD